MKDFTVLIPVFNTKPQHLYEAVYSILNQNIKQSFNILLVDDASNNYETIIAINALTKHNRVQMFALTENKGTSGALNKGHELIESEYIAIMGSDDISDRSRLSSQMAFIEKNPMVDVVGTNLFSFYDDDIERNRRFTSKHPLKPTLANTTNGWLVNHGTVIYKNQSVKDVGGYKLPGRGQDVDLWTRMAQNGKTFANIEPVLYAWRRFR